ncbi:hypothetical protein ACFL7D_10670 [candidate division KSB1 bacterium]
MKSKIYIPAAVFLIIFILTGLPVNAQRVGTPFGLSAENPGISVMGTFLSKYSSELKRPGFGISDAEIGFQSPVDPFARFDVLLHYASDRFVSGHDHSDNEHEHSSGFEVEEALITLMSLPGNLQLSGGRMRSKIGILNVIHLHDYNFAHYPKIITHYWGGEGLVTDGVRASWLAPMPFWTEFVFEGQKTQTEEDTDYATGSLNLFFPIGESAGIMLTGSGYFDKQNEFNQLIPDLHHDEEEQEAEHEEELNEFIDELIKDRNEELNGFGFGLRYKWKPITQALYRHFIFQSEVMTCMSDII